MNLACGSNEAHCLDGRSVAQASTGPDEQSDCMGVHVKPWTQGHSASHCCLHQVKSDIVTDERFRGQTVATKT